MYKVFGEESEAGAIEIVYSIIYFTVYKIIYFIQN